MLSRSCVVALGCCTLLLLGCGGRAEPEHGTDKSTPPAQKGPPAAGVQSVTLHVEGMARRLGLF